MNLINGYLENIILPSYLENFILIRITTADIPFFLLLRHTFLAVDPTALFLVIILVVLHTIIADQIEILVEYIKLQKLDKRRLKSVNEVCEDWLCFTSIPLKYRYETYTQL